MRFSTTPALGSTQNRTYAEALTLLDSLQSNRTISSSISSSTVDMNAHAIPEMLEWTRKAGYAPEDFAKRGLSCIHVAGTKGKGSVCVMVESVLRQYRAGAAGVEGGLEKIGLYTSPHLVTPRERIRIDGAPIAEDLFARYFFEIWDRLEAAAATSAGEPGDSVSAAPRPGYFRYLTIMALHTFVQEGVQSAIMECGIGGEYDSTNILPAEAVSVAAIARLGIDHVGMLGDTIEQIAWHKAGIMKKGVRSFTVPQVPEAQSVLRKRAEEKASILHTVLRIPEDIVLGLQGDFQRDNASLAVYVAAMHLDNMGVRYQAPTVPHGAQAAFPEPFLAGLKSAAWPGRCETRTERNLQWYIDGAHTLESIHVAATWFVSQVQAAIDAGRSPTAIMLIFNQQDRDAEPLLRELLTVMRTLTGSRSFTYAVFCTNAPFTSDAVGGDPLEVQETAARVYRSMDGGAMSMVIPSIEEAVYTARRLKLPGDRIMVFATGSLYLVGGLLKVLDSTFASENFSGRSSPAPCFSSTLKIALSTTKRLPRNEKCPFCKKFFTAPAFEKHLEQYTQDGSDGRPRLPPDGIHVASEIEKMRADKARPSLDMRKKQVPKEDACPFCKKMFTRRGLARHLDRYIRDGTAGRQARSPDGVHVVGEIRKLRAAARRRRLK